MENPTVNVSGNRRTQAYVAQADPLAATGNYWKRISWGSVIAGVLVAIVVQLALSLLGIGIGLSTVDATEENNPVAGLGTGAAIWYAVSSLLALFAGGWVAGRMAATPRTFDSVLHGILTWSLVTIVTFYLLTTAIGNIIGGVGNLVKGTLSTVGTVAGAGVAAAGPSLGESVSSGLKEQGIDVNNLRGEISQLLSQTGKPGLQPGTMERQAENAADRAATNPQAADDILKQLFNGKAEQIDRNAVINVVVARTSKSRAEAEQTADNWIKTYQQAQVKWEQTKKEAEATAREAADKAADATSTASILAFVSLLLGAAVAGFGAKKGNDSKDDELDTVRATRTA